MLATFCLRLACGLAAALLLLPAAQINPRFYRAHFLTVLGLTATAAVASYGTAGWGLGLALAAGMVTAFLGSFVWSLEGAPAGRMLVVVTTAALVAALALASQPAAAPEAIPITTAGFPGLFLDNLTSAALLGAATTAMLMGHSYLIAPAMSLTPLLRLLAALFVALVLRMALAGVGLWSWTAGHSLTNLEDEAVLWLPLRWGLGFLLPLVLGGMAWQTARIRSTQSATGILYVVVIFCFLGELTSQLLVRDTGFLL